MKQKTLYIAGCSLTTLLGACLGYEVAESTTAARKSQQMSTMAISLRPEEPVNFQPTEDQIIEAERDLRNRVESGTLPSTLNPPQELKWAFETAQGRLEKHYAQESRAQHITLTFFTMIEGFLLGFISCFIHSKKPLLNSNAVNEITSFSP